MGQNEGSDKRYRTMDWLATILLLSGIALLSTGPVVERLAGSHYLSGTILAAFALVVAGAIAGLIYADSDSGRFSGMVSVGVIGWGILAKGLAARQHPTRRESAAGEEHSGPSQEKTNGDHGARCSKELIDGADERSGWLVKRNWRSELHCKFEATGPTKDGVSCLIHVFGKAYYGLWFRWGEIIERPYYQVNCVPVGGECEIDGTLTGVPGGQDSIVRGDVLVVPRILGKSTLIAKIHMGGFFHADGGPKLSASIGKEGVASVGVEVEWPSATYTTAYRFKPFTWRCEKVSEVVGGESDSS